jgi:hypothetical protein
MNIEKITRKIDAATDKEVAELINNLNFELLEFLNIVNKYNIKFDYLGQVDLEHMALKVFESQDIGTELEKCQYYNEYYKRVIDKLIKDIKEYPKYYDALKEDKGGI